jgi:hypothetical protein
MMDGFGADESVSIMAATNLPWDLDSAILSRFQTQILVDLPRRDMREFKVYHKLSGALDHFVKKRSDGAYPPSELQDNIPYTRENFGVKWSEPEDVLTLRSKKASLEEKVQKAQVRYGERQEELRQTQIDLNDAQVEVDKYETAWSKWGLQEKVDRRDELQDEVKKLTKQLKIIDQKMDNLKGEIESVEAQIANDLPFPGAQLWIRIYRVIAPIYYGETTDIIQLARTIAQRTGPRDTNAAWTYRVLDDVREYSPDAKCEYGMSLRDLDRVLDGGIRAMSRRALQEYAIPFPQDLIQSLDLPLFYSDFWLHISEEAASGRQDARPIAELGIKEINGKKVDLKRMVVSYDVRASDFLQAIDDRQCTINDEEYRQMKRYFVDPGSFKPDDVSTHVLPEIEFGNTNRQIIEEE